jgi:RES domain-containing protein
MNHGLGTLTHNSTTVTFDFAGTTFRLIPHSSTEPLSTTYSLGGGRWNPPNAFEVMYSFTNTTTARQYMIALETYGGFSWLAAQPEKQLDLVVLNWNVLGLVDLATNEGLAVYNLPPSYPSGFQDDSSWPRTQPIGAAIHGADAIGLVARSASATNFAQPVINWAELAMFTHRAPVPEVVERISFDDWYA